jgi:hypothetical protein
MDLDLTKKAIRTTKIAPKIVPTTIAMMAPVLSPVGTGSVDWNSLFSPATAKTGGRELSNRIGGGIVGGGCTGCGGSIGG